MRRTRILGSIFVVSAAFWVAGMAPVRAPVTGAEAVAHTRALVVGQHTLAPTAASTVMAYDEADGESMTEPTVGSTGVVSRPSVQRGASPTPPGADPACANRASRQALSSHPSTAPPARI